MRPQTVVERLDFVAKRIPGLKFTPPTQLKPGDDLGYGCFMSCDMYYIEIKVDQSHQTVKDVVISHGNNADGISCPVLRKVLQDQDFETFAKHLTGLHSIYQINTSDKKVKQKAYPALTALETDLAILYDHQRRRINNCHDIIHKSPLGIMEPRKGGLPVRLTYFITPYDLVDTNQKGLINPTINNIIDKNLGLSATIEIEGSTAHKLQVKSLISTQQNSSLPAYAPFNSQNSEKLPAQFVLRLSQPLPMLNTSINQMINEINEPSTIKDYLSSVATNSKESLISLIARQELDLNKGPFCRSLDLLKGPDGESCDLQKHVYSVKLIDQNHSYHVLDHYLGRQDGVYVTKIPFTHPTSIPNILRVLRQQALFNFIIGSCIRRNKVSNNLIDESGQRSQTELNIFDITPVSLNNVYVSFEHPSKESLATLEIDIRELSCQLYALDEESVCSNEFATKVLQKCWSIPVTLRSVLKKCNERRLALLEDANKRRERELQELLTSNATQQGTQIKSHLQYQEALLQSKFNSINEKTNQRDLNSMAEFLSAKVTGASTSDASNQTNTNVDANNRSNLLRKFSCKPKVKQNTATKNQTGNKILSLMLKRPNSTTSSADDANLKATLIKKVKTKNLTGETSLKSSNVNTITTTKLISPEVANAARLASKLSKFNQPNQSVSLSLIRSPNKTQNAVTSSATTSTAMNMNLSQQVVASSSKQHDPQLLLNPSSVNSSGIRVKSQPNGNNSISKPRKSSIGSVIDRLVGGVTPEQNQSAVTGSSSDSNPESTKNLDSSKSALLGAKLKNRTTSDKFAIKQGSLGSLKLTVTKTKPTISSTSTSSSSASSSTPPTSSNPATSNIASTSTLPAILSSSTASTTKSEASKVLGLGSSTPNIKYTIPKISKTQQASQSNSSLNQANSTELSNSNTTSESNTQSDDSSNPTSSNVNALAPSSSTINKRTTPTPFNRTNNSVRNPVSSSTHPLGRTISNPLASTNRPSSTNDNHLINRISSSNQAQQPRQQQINYRMINVQQQLQMQQQQLQQNQRMIIPNMTVAQFVNDNLQRPSPSVTSSSDSGNPDTEPTISTPSSPTECGHIETVRPPALIPIDSLDEPQADDDHPDDESDRLSIVDINENIADSNSTAGTPKSTSSPSNVQEPSVPQSSSTLSEVESNETSQIKTSQPNNVPENEDRMAPQSTAIASTNDLP